MSRDDDHEVESGEDMAFRKSVIAQQGPAFGKGGAKGAGFGACEPCVKDRHHACKKGQCACSCRTGGTR